MRPAPASMPALLLASSRAPAFPGPPSRWRRTGALPTDADTLDRRRANNGRASARFAAAPHGANARDYTDWRPVQEIIPAPAINNRNCDFVSSKLTYAHLFARQQSGS